MKNNEEIWKAIPGYNGHYLVSNYGRVYSLPNHQHGLGGLMKQRADKDGYMKVKLTCGKKRKLWFVHRLVAICFIPNPNNLPCINHKDESRTNNNVDNLEWCTPKYNRNYGTCSEKISKHFSIAIIAIDTNGLIKEFSSLVSAAKELNCSTGHIAACCKGKLKHYKGYKWQYK